MYTLWDPECSIGRHSRLRIVSPVCHQTQQLTHHPRSINPGDSFYTNNGIFLWEMGQGFNVSGNLIGNNNTQVNFNGTAEQYADNKLDNCDVSGRE